MQRSDLVSDIIPKVLLDIIYDYTHYCHKIYHIDNDSCRYLCIKETELFIS
jgi:hypothetical protein